MNSSSSVLRSPRLSSVSQMLGGGVGGDMVDLEEIRRAAFEAGVEEGLRRAVEPVEDATNRAKVMLERAVASAIGELRSAAVGSTRQITEQALDIARRVVGTVPDHVADGLLDRISAALEEIDDDEIELIVHPHDEQGVAALFGGRVTVRTDPTLSPGDAKVEGTWSRADLTLATAWDLVREAYDA